MLRRRVGTHKERLKDFFTVDTGQSIGAITHVAVHKAVATHDGSIDNGPMGNGLLVKVVDALTKIQGSSFEPCSQHRGNPIEPVGAPQSGQQSPILNGPG